MWNITFTQQKEYYLTETTDSLRLKIGKIVKQKWSDFSENISGELNDDNSFKLYQKWSLLQIGWFENRPSYLSGTITQEGNTTKLETQLRPNPMIIFLFYFFIVMVLCELIGVETFLNAGKGINVIFYLIFVFMMYGFIRYFPKALQNRFERLVDLT